MDDTLCQRFFQTPSCPLQRQYEALRAVFADGRPQKEVAERFGYSYDAFRQLVHQFRQSCAADQPPPFFSNPVSVGHRQRRQPPKRRGRSRPPSPTSAP
jgi:hypothetical protein